MKNIKKEAADRQTRTSCSVGKIVALRGGVMVEPEELVVERTAGGNPCAAKVVIVEVFHRYSGRRYRCSSSLMSFELPRPEQRPLRRRFSPKEPDCHE